MPMTDSGAMGSQGILMGEQDLAYRAPFSNYAGLKVEYPEGYDKTKQLSSVPTYKSSGYDKEISQFTKQFANLTGRSDASSESRQSLPQSWQWNGAQSLNEEETMARQMLAEYGDNSSSRPRSAELKAMASRIAESRNMNEEQEEQVREMLVDLTDRIYGGGMGQPSSSGFPKQTGTRGLIHGTSTNRPDARELQEIAEAIGERCGADQVEPAMAVLGVMTDVLFGGSQSRGAVPSYMQRPSPRTLEAITQRVVQRTGNMQKANTINDLAARLTDSVFGGAGSQDLPTARSSVRSQSTGSDVEVRPEINLEVRGLLTELCSALFSQ